VNQKSLLFNIPVDSLTMLETVEIIDEAIQNNKQIFHTVINAGKVVAMQKDKQLFHSIVSADIINADGQAIVWASRILGKRVPERVTGIDLMEALVELAYTKHYKIFFLGAKKEVVNEVVRSYSEKYSPDILAGYRNGYFSADEQSAIALQISESNADMLFVAISSPVKENFLDQYRGIFKNVKLIMGVGGSFDVIAGKIKRSPLWMQQTGLEWLHRFAQEPKRMWKRYTIGNLIFILLVMKELMRKN